MHHTHTHDSTQQAPQTMATTAAAAPDTQVVKDLGQAIDDDDTGALACVYVCTNLRM